MRERKGVIRDTELPLGKECSRSRLIKPNSESLFGIWRMIIAVLVIFV
jgi:hypothetical protein